MNSSRRSFLGTTLAVPALASVPSESGAPAQSPAQKSPVQSTPKLVFGPLGKTGMKITRVSFGCMTTSDQSVIERAADMGINYFDTARVYQGGNNERMVGAALKKIRNKVFISSKTQARDKAQALADLETSLRELQTDHLDVWHLHSRSTPDMVNDDVLEAQRIAKKDGKIRFAGVSFHGGHTEMIPAMLKLKFFDVFLLSYNYTMDAKTIDPLIEEAHKAGVGIIAMKGLAGGVRPTVRSYKIDQDQLNKLTREGAPVAALKWAIRNKSVDTIIPSIVDNEQLEQNIAAMSSPYGSGDAKLLAMQLQEIGPLYCRYCGNCTGQCPKGLPVSDMLRFVMYAEGYRQFGMAREQFQMLPQEVQDVRCADCSECAVKCPNGVRVSERLERAQQLFA